MYTNCQVLCTMSACCVCSKYICILLHWYLCVWGGGGDGGGGDGGGGGYGGLSTEIMFRVWVTVPACCTCLYLLL